VSGFQKVFHIAALTATAAVVIAATQDVAAEAGSGNAAHISKVFAASR